MGFSLSEIFLLIIVGIIVVGPKRLPGMMRTAGQWVARLRRMSVDLRSQSGIDDLLRQEGLEQHIHELRSLSRLNVVDTLMAPAAAPIVSPPLDAPTPRAAVGAGSRPKLRGSWQPDEPLREREYPLAGCDAYGALADDIAVYAPPPEPEAVAAPPAAEPAEQASVTMAEAAQPAIEAPVPVDAPATEARS